MGDGAGAGAGVPDEPGGGGAGAGSVAAGAAQTGVPPGPKPDRKVPDGQLMEARNWAMAAAAGAPAVAENVTDFLESSPLLDYEFGVSVTK
mgnify:FL=1